MIVMIAFPPKKYPDEENKIKIINIHLLCLRKVYNDKRIQIFFKLGNGGKQ